ncbi:ABC transporter ATP-binding protein/permease [Cryobacterium sp. 1639]|uniref:ABC transporter ATP-binding protein n=1 Tax=Cryobacterium inferilacus TaxID=2866629 RepID=UPI001C739CFC|nr:ABC transporter ATP-binding protein [Cryobacterium sp. 1639]MBX0301332.1 ABC transporter ATP-binding protein/permease [Cryobacterium sp. 1639]
MKLSNLLEHLRIAMSLLPGRHRGWLVGAVLGSVLLAALDMLGVAAMLPLLDLLTNGTSGTYGGWLAGFFGTDDMQTLIILCGSLIAAAFILKSVVSIAFRWWLLGRINQLAADTASELLRAYLLSPYSTHRMRALPAIYRNLGMSIDETFGRVLTGLVTLLSNLITVVGIAAVLLIVSPLATIVAITVFASATLGIQALLKSRQLAIGDRVAAADVAGWRVVTPSLEGFRDTRIAALAGAYVQRYRAARTARAHAARSFTLMSELPRYALEIVFILTIILLTVLLFATSSSATALSVLGLFAVASVRLLPTMNQVSAMMTSIRAGEAGMKLLVAEIEEFGQHTPHQEERLSIEAHRGDIVIDDVVFAYPDSDEQILRGVTTIVRSGEMTAFVGSSGAGKSTLLDLVLGLLTPTSGQILSGGRSIYDDPQTWFDSLGMVSQDVFLFDGTLRQNIAFGVPDEDIDEIAIQEALASAQLTSFIAALDQGLDTRVGERGVRLSGGQRQRIGIARALYRRPAVLVLDEATSALDNATEAQIAETIDALKGRMTILVVAHRLSTVKNADRIVFMSDGRIAAEGDMSSLSERNAEFRHLVELGRLT